MSGPTKPAKPAAPNAPKKPVREHVTTRTLSSGMPGYEAARFKALTEQKARAEKSGNPADWNDDLESQLDAARIADAAAKKAPPAPAPKPEEEG